VIRQAISCDICGTEKKQTNHWFVAYDQGGELRVSGWASRNRLRPGSKHLCGQTCLHKLVDDFMARALSARPQQTALNDDEEEQPARTDTSLTSAAAYPEVESSARLIPAPLSAAARLAPRPPMEVVPAPVRVLAEEAGAGADEAPRFASRSWRAEAWERERERELRAVERRPESGARRRAGS
jgi:hypothetical protein